MKSSIIFFLLFLTASLSFGQSGTKIQGPALIEGFETTASAAGTTTLTKDSQTKQIITGVTTQTIVLPDATTLPLGRKFLIINKSTGSVTVQDASAGALATVVTTTQAEFHLRAAGSAAGTWDVLSSSGGGGGTWGSITGTLSNQTDLQSALDLKAPLANPSFTGTVDTELTGDRVLISGPTGALVASSTTPTTLGYLDVSSSLTTQLAAKAPLASPTFSGTVTTPVTASRALVTGASSELAASATTATQIGYLSTTTSDVQTQLDAKQARSTLTTKGDIYVATASATTARQGVGAAGETLLADPDTTNGVRYGTAVGTDNYLKANPSFEGNAVTGWTTYADSAATQPDASGGCTGGTPNTTFAINSSAPVLNGSYQGLATLNTGATRQGEGFSYAFSIPTKYSATPGVHQIEFDYAISGGTFVAGSESDRTSAGDSTFTVWIYDVTNSQLIQPSTYRLRSTVGDKFVANFQNNAASTSYRLCIHKGTSATVSGSNITVKFDDFRLFPAQYVYGTPITDWVSYTPTFTGFGTATSIKFISRRVGDSLQVQGTFSPGTSTATTAQVTLGYGGANANVTADSAKLQALGVVGSAAQSASSTTFFGISVLANGGNNYFNFGAQTSIVGASAAANGNALGAGSGGTITLTASVPISGWSSSSQVSDGYDGRDISFIARGTPTGTLNTGYNKVTFAAGTVQSDTVAGFSGGTYTIRSSGKYDISYNQRMDWATGVVNGDSGVAIYINGANVSEQFVKTGATGVLQAMPIVTLIGRQLNASDTVEFYSYNSNTTPTFNTGTISVARRQSPTTISATEVVAAFYNTSAGQTIATATDSVVNFGTLVDDTHNAVTTGAAWKFTCPVAGKYFVSTGVVYVTQFTTVGSTILIGVRKNSSLVFQKRRSPYATTGGPYYDVSVSGYVNCNAGDTIDVMLNQNDGGNRLLTTTALENFVSIYRIK